MTKVLVFDTETTGLPIFINRDYHDPSLLEFYDSSRVIELGYIIYENKVEICRKSSLIKTMNVNIENSHIHGITNKMVNKSGKNIITVLREFEKDIDGCVLIAHNVQFDTNVILSECHRYDITSLINKLSTIRKECTMAIAKDKFNMKRNVKLIDLYKYFNNNKIKQLHRAIDDVELCANCYFNLLKI